MNRLNGCRNGRRVAPSIAEAAAQHVPAQLSRDSKLRLLLTAAMRGHYGAVQIMAAAPAVEQHLDTATLERLLSTVTCQCWSYGATRVLCGLPAAKQLGVIAVARLMMLAVSAGKYYAIEHFAQLPAAARLDSTVVAQLLHAAAKLPSYRRCIDCMCEVLKLPAAQKASPEDTTAFIQAVVQPGCSSDHQYQHAAQGLLEGFPRAWRLRKADVLEQLLRCGLQHHPAAVKQLCDSITWVVWFQCEYVQTSNSSREVEHAHNVHCVDYAVAVLGLGSARLMQLLLAAVE
jgi:hypothetical protein